jgi:hypothetical protein
MRNEAEGAKVECLDKSAHQLPQYITNEGFYAYSSIVPFTYTTHFL